MLWQILVDLLLQQVFKKLFVFSPGPVSSALSFAKGLGDNRGVLLVTVLMVWWDKRLNGKRLVRKWVSKLILGWMLKA